MSINQTCRRRAPSAIGLLLMLVLGLAIAGCTAKSSGLYQFSTIDALLDGNYDGEPTFAELRQQGDFGLGTFDALDGEMLAFEGRFYQVRSDGSVSAVPDQMRTPFSAVTFFHADLSRRLDGPLGYAELQRQLDAMRKSDGHAFAFRIDGEFKSVRTRSVSRQDKPYRRLAEVVKDQSIFQLDNVSGTLVGFWCPESLRHVNVPGYHFHFLTNDESAGGHVLDLALINGTVQMQELSGVHVALPQNAPATQPSADRAGDLERVEK